MCVLDSRATPRDVRARRTEANMSGRNFPLLKKVLLLLHLIVASNKQFFLIASDFRSSEFAALKRRTRLVITVITGSGVPTTTASGCNHTLNGRQDDPLLIMDSFPEPGSHQVPTLSLGGPSGTDV